MMIELIKLTLFELTLICFYCELLLSSLLDRSRNYFSLYTICCDSTG